MLRVAAPRCADAFFALVLLAVHWPGVRARPGQSRRRRWRIGATLDGAVLPWAIIGMPRQGAAQAADVVIGRVISSLFTMPRLRIDSPRSSIR